MTARTVAALVSASALLLGACGEASGSSTAGTDRTPSSEDTAMTSSAGAPGPAAQAVATVTAKLSRGPLGDPFPAGVDGLRVSYTVTNRGSDPILVVTERGHDQSSDSVAPAAPESAWVGAGETAGVARLSKQVFDAPGGVELAAPWRAPAELVDAGSSVQGSMKAPLPLRPDLPRSTEALTVQDEPLSGEATSVEICVQVAPDPRAQHPDAFTDEITHGTPGRRLVCSEPQTVPQG